MSYDYETRKIALAYFHDLIFYGFVRSSRMFAGHNLVIKTLTKADRRVVVANPREPLALALSIYAVDGEVVYDPTHNLRALRTVNRLLGKAPFLLTQVIAVEIGTIQAWLSRLDHLFPEYLESDESRELWARWIACGKSRGVAVEDAVADAVAPSEWFIAWHRTNVTKDRHEEHDVLWTMVRTLAAVTNPKVGNKLPKSLYKDAKIRSEVENRIIKPIRSDKDLVQQLEAFVKGDKDAHDRIIDQLEAQWKEEGEKAQRELDEKMEKRRNVESDELISSTYRVVET